MKKLCCLLMLFCLLFTGCTSLSKTAEESSSGSITVPFLSEREAAHIVSDFIEIHIEQLKYIDSISFGGKKFYRFLSDSMCRMISGEKQFGRFFVDQQTGDIYECRFAEDLAQLIPLQQLKFASANQAQRAQAEAAAESLFSDKKWSVYRFVKRGDQLYCIFVVDNPWDPYTSDYLYYDMLNETLYHWDIIADSLSAAAEIILQNDALQIVANIINQDNLQLRGDYAKGGYYYIQAVALGEMAEDGSQISFTQGRFLVDMTTGEPYAVDINTNQRLPLGKMKLYYDTEETHWNSAMEKADIIFPGRNASVYHFVEREGRKYCVFQILEQSSEWSYNEYYFFDLVTEELLLWEIEEDTLTACRL